MVLDQQVQEPTLLVFALIVMGFIAALGACVLAIAGLPAFGYIWWIFAAVAAILGWLVWGIRRKPKPSSPSDRLRWFRRILGLARLLFIILLTCWLGLIIWSVFCAGGPAPPAKTDAALSRADASSSKPGSRTARTKPASGPPNPHSTFSMGLAFGALMASW